MFNLFEENYIEYENNNNIYNYETKIIKCSVSDGREWILNNISNIEKYFCDNIDNKGDYKDNL